MKSGTNEVRENPLATEKISRLLMNYSIPAMIAILINAAYNIADQIFLGQSVGYLGNAATTIIFPLLTIVMAIAGLLGTGATTYSAVELGRGNRSESEKALNTVFIFTLGIGLFFAIVSFLGIEPILRLSGAALATITSQFVSACIMVSYFMKKSNIMRLSRTALRPNMKLCLEIVKLGISAGITQFAAFIMQIVMNNTLQYYGN